LGLAGTIGLYFLLTIGTQILFYVLLGGALTVFYTADPLSLKCLGKLVTDVVADPGTGLGDVVIFLCFGPLLMQGCAIVLVGETSHTIFLYSIVWGLLTENILHANNTRDIETDKKAGKLAKF
jgi:1,4-dihydroxy-2-naphthoate octaprenyltransferase